MDIELKLKKRNDPAEVELAFKAAMRLGTRSHSFLDSDNIDVYGASHNSENQSLATTPSASGSSTPRFPNGGNSKQRIGKLIRRGAANQNADDVCSTTDVTPVRVNRHLQKQIEQESANEYDEEEEQEPEQVIDKNARVFRLWNKQSKSLIQIPEEELFMNMKESENRNQNQENSPESRITVRDCRNAIARRLNVPRLYVNIVNDWYNPHKTFSLALDDPLEIIACLNNVDFRYRYVIESENVELPTDWMMKQEEDQQQSNSEKENQSPKQQKQCLHSSMEQLNKCVDSCELYAFRQDYLKCNGNQVLDCAIVKGFSVLAQALINAPETSAEVLKRKNCHTHEVGGKTQQVMMTPFVLALLHKQYDVVIALLEVDLRKEQILTRDDIQGRACGRDDYQPIKVLDPLLVLFMALVENHKQNAKAFQLLLDHPFLEESAFEQAGKEVVTALTLVMINADNSECGQCDLEKQALLRDYLQMFKAVARRKFGIKYDLVQQQSGKDQADQSLKVVATKSEC